MKLQTKLILLMGGTAFAVSALVITLALLHFNSTLDRIQRAGNDYALDAMRERAKNNAVSVKAASSLIFQRVATAAITLESRNNANPNKEFEERMKRNRGANAVVYGQFRADGSFDPALLRGLFRNTADRIVELDSAALLASSFQNLPAGDAERITFLSNPFLFRKLAALPLTESFTTYFSDGADCWIVHLYRQDAQPCFYAVRIDQDFFRGALTGGDDNAYMLLAEGKIVLKYPPAIPWTSEMESAAKELERRFETGDSDTVIAKNFRFNGNQRWYVTAVPLTVPFYGEKSILLLRFYEYDSLMPALTQALDVNRGELYLYIIALAFIGFLLVLLPLTWIARQTSKPILQAVAVANTLAEGEFPPHTTTRGGSTEINQLMVSLNHMSDRLNIMIGKLKRSHERELAARRDAESSSRLKSDFLNTVAYDVRCRLNTVSGFAQALLQTIHRAGNAPETRRAESALHVIASSVADLDEMLGTLQDLSLIGHQDMHLHRRDFDTFSLMRAVVDPLHHEARKRTLEIETHYASDLPRTLYSDNDRLADVLTLVLTPLIRNAPPTGKMSFSCSADGDYIAFRVRGAAENPLPAAFLLYSRDADKKEGEEQHSRPKNFEIVSGIIKLALAKHMTLLLGGEFEMICGENSEFTAQLLFHRSDLSNRATTETSLFTSISVWNHVRDTMHETRRREFRSAHSAGDAVCSEIPNVFALLPDRNDAELMCMYFEDAPCNFAAGCTKKALADQLCESECDILILDLQLGGIDFKALISRIRENPKRRNIFIVLLSASAADASFVKEAGADSFFLKPVDLKKLREALCHG